MVIGSSNVLTPLSSSGHLPRYQRLSHSGTGSDHYQGPDTTPWPSLLLESPTVMCGSPTLTILIPCSISCSSTCQSPISSKCRLQMSLSWSMSPRQIRINLIYSSIQTPRTNLYPPGLVHLRTYSMFDSPAKFF